MHISGSVVDFIVPGPVIERLCFVSAILPPYISSLHKNKVKVKNEDARMQIKPKICPFVLKFLLIYLKFTAFYISKDLHPFVIGIRDINVVIFIYENP